MIKSGHVRRSKLYYLRGMKGKSAKVTEKIASGKAVDGEGNARETADALSKE